MIISRKSCMLCPNCGQTLTLSTSVSYHGDERRSIMSALKCECPVCSVDMYEVDPLLRHAMRTLAIARVPTNSHCSIIHEAVDGWRDFPSELPPCKLTRNHPVLDVAGLGERWVEGPYIILEPLPSAFIEILEKSIKDFIDTYDKFTIDVYPMFEGSSSLCEPYYWDVNTSAQCTAQLFVAIKANQLLRPELLVEANEYLTDFVAKWARDLHNTLFGFCKPKKVFDIATVSFLDLHPPAYYGHPELEPKDAEDKEKEDIDDADKA